MAQSVPRQAIIWDSGCGPIWDTLPWDVHTSSQLSGPSGPFVGCFRVAMYGPMLVYYVGCSSFSSTRSGPVGQSVLPRRAKVVLGAQRGECNWGLPFCFHPCKELLVSFPRERFRPGIPTTLRSFPVGTHAHIAFFCIYHPLANAEDFMPFGPVPCDFVPGTLSEYLESARERKGMATFIPGSRP